MKLRIFLAPFQLIDEKNKKLYTLNESTLITKDLGKVLGYTIGLLLHLYRDWIQVNYVTPVPHFEIGLN